MIDALNRECKDIALLIAYEIHRDRIKSLNIQYHETFESHGILEYVYHKRAYFYRLNFRILPNYVGVRHAQYITRLDYRSVKFMRTLAYLPDRYIYSKGEK